MAFSASFSTSAITGALGFSFDSGIDDDSAGSALAFVDLNGDGFEDLVISAYQAPPNGAASGSVYVIWGKASGFGALTGAGVIGSTGFRLDGSAAFDALGSAVANAGDFNGDGLEDLLITSSATTEVYLVFGSHQPFGSGPAATLAANPAAGLRLAGVTAGDFLFPSVAGLGDIDGDGFDDIAVGASNHAVGGAIRVGGAYVVFGRAGGAGTVALSALNGATGFTMQGVLANDRIGDTVARLGDINGDGLADFAVSSETYGPDDRGSIFVIYGRRGGFAASFELTSLNGTNGFRINGKHASDMIGTAVGPAGDINGDGLADLAIGATQIDAAYVIFGSSAARPAVFDLASLNGVNGFEVTSAPGMLSHVGRDALVGGDINGDGFDDLIVGSADATAAGHLQGGQTYVVFGKAGGFAPSASVDVLAAAGGFRIDGAAASAEFGLAGAVGDVNGDGLTDVLLGAPQLGGPGNQVNSGRAYLLFGQALGAATTGADSFTGAAGADVYSGLAGDDMLRGLGGNDVMRGGPGTDTSAYAAGAASYEWWGGTDGTWRVKDLRAGSPEGTDVLSGVERLQFTDKTVKIAGLTTAEKLTDAYSNILRSTATGSELTFLNGLIASVNGSTKTLGAAITEIVGKADQTTAVAAMSYQFFLNFVPSKGGFDYLVSPQGPNPNNINSAYYQSFNIENRYINFAVNLGKAGEGAPSFLAEYGSKTLFQATKDAYMEIFGGTVVDSKINTILDSSVGSMSRAQYFALYGGDGLTGIGTKAAMVGWLLTEAAKADLGMYAQSSNAFLTDLADGAQTLVDVVGTYGKAEYVFNG